MKYRLLILTLCLILASALSAGIVQPPRFMLLPDKGWCTANGYTTQSENNGKVDIVPNYAKAIEDANFSKVAEHVSALINEVGLPVVSYEDGVASDENPDAPQSDILVEIGWSVTPHGPGYICSYRLTATDVRSGERIGAISGEQRASSNRMPQYQFVNMAISRDFPILIGQLQDFFQNQTRTATPSR